MYLDNLPNANGYLKDGDDLTFGNLNIKAILLQDIQRVDYAS